MKTYVSMSVLLLELSFSRFSQLKSRSSTSTSSSYSVFPTESTLKLATKCRQPTRPSPINIFSKKNVCVFLKLMINWNGHSQVICGSKGLHSNGNCSAWVRYIDNSIEKLICQQPQWSMVPRYRVLHHYCRRCRCCRHRRRRCHCCRYTA